VCSNAARSQILSIRDIYREGKIDIVWIWVHRLFLAGLTTVYCLSHSAEVRRQISLEELMETMQACSGVLSVSVSYLFPETLFDSGYLGTCGAVSRCCWVQRQFRETCRRNNLKVRQDTEQLRRQSISTAVLFPKCRASHELECFPLPKSFDAICWKGALLQSRASRN
jgi:hypothetical protein